MTHFLDFMLHHLDWYLLFQRPKNLQSKRHISTLNSRAGGNITILYGLTFSPLRRKMEPTAVGVTLRKLVACIGMYRSKYGLQLKM